MIRSLIFKFFFYLGLITICLFFLPSLFLPKRAASFGGKLIGYWAYFCLKFFLSTKFVILGKENINQNEKFFIACTHQSEFETYFLQTLFNSPYFILKKELIRIPIFGSYLKKIGCIEIERDRISRENLNFMEKVENSIKTNSNPLIIFPQGTRKKVDERPNFKKGVAKIYDLQIKCLPIVINSGDIWPKHGLMKSNKKLIISILKPLDIGLNSETFLANLQNLMYKELDKIA